VHDAAPRKRHAVQVLHATIDLEKENTMYKSLKGQQRIRRLAGSALIIVAAAALFALPPVRALASDLLGMFRVQSFVAVEFEMDRLEEVTAAMGEEMIFGEEELLEDPGPPVQVASIADAQALVDFPLRAMWGDTQPESVMVTGQTKLRFRPNVAELRSLFETLELDPNLLPAGIDGQPFDFTLPAGVMINYSSSHGDVTLNQVRSPSAEAPDGVDIQQLGVAILELLGMSHDEALRFSESIDFTTTLVMPVPAGLASAKEVQVDGVTGLLFESTDEELGEASIVLWQKNGIVYTVSAETGNETWLLQAIDRLSE
jgi:hypothetical protein